MLFKVAHFFATAITLFNQTPNAFLDCIIEEHETQLFPRSISLLNTGPADVLIKCPVT